MKRIGLALVLISLLLTTGLFAGGQTDESAPTKLIVSSRLYSQPGEQQFLIDEIFPEFEEANDCIVMFEIMEDDPLLKRAAFQKESGRVNTDVVIAHAGRMSEWMNNDYVVPLPVDDWKDRTFSKAFKESISMGGKTYFAPVGGDVYLMLANKKALPYLPAGADVQDLSWEEYVDWAVAIAEGEGEGKAAVTGVPMKSLIYMYGGMFLSYGGEFPVINSPGAIRGWEVLAKMKDAYTPTVNTYDNVSSPMKTGEAWLTVAHMVRCGEAYKSNPSGYVLGPAPKGPEGIGSIAGTSGFGVVNGAPNEELAVKFIEYMTEPEMAVRIARGTGGFIPPIDEAIAKLGDSLEDEIIGKGINVMKNGVVSGVPGGDYTSWGAVKQVYDDAFQELILNRGAIDKAYLDEAQAKINALKK
ncbi:MULTISPECIES: ABC transporter substrate-binding protein [unclassified Oceanispirochaeta]|uniref:ABC transporter substrate-binding protein n=1 Tax=unclassified Oceanispirochaeta TaxID=2635722 RepID=UPI000E08DC32|nr:MULTISPECIES: extracellular solute-binding protein [unclassified Oceanispirochaeta]MBF9016935.1 extracellular solute-binding protein [Oceanispirochaeta sp. M2]NPD73298.1 extracellular solute-binding protein [Oceanispirochaeta sp. M1]RDG30961.1 extracellular solute-binding protein [Oceanispirochaeta sp. M1]